MPPIEEGELGDRAAVGVERPDARPTDGHARRPNRAKNVAPPLVLPHSCREWHEIADAIMHHYETTRMCPHVEECARVVVLDLEKHLNAPSSGIRHLYRPGNQYQRQEYSEVTLTIVGSVGSGIAGQLSNVDVCVRFERSPNVSQNLNHKSILRAIAAIVKEKENVDVKEILTQEEELKLQFTVSREDIQLTFDVSYYDMAALYSSSLMRAYCEWEPRRLPALLLWTKRWAEICQDEKKRLPLYSYTVMLIHFLQRCTPRILPRLQHEFASRDDPFEMRSFGYFHRTVLPRWSKNVHTVGRIWVEFLHYFTHIKYEKKMISMRTKHTTPNTPGLVGGFMTIENPFKRDHNIAMQIKKPAFDHTLRAFRQALAVFSTQGIRNTLCPDVPKEWLDRSLGVALLRRCSVAEPSTGRNTPNRDPESPSTDAHYDAHFPALKR